MTALSPAGSMVALNALQGSGLRCGLQRWAATGAAASGTRKADVPTPSWAQQLGGNTPQESQVLAANRDFLLSGAGAGRQVLLHDYRDVKWLKRISAAGLAGTLMSSSGVAYAVSFGMPLEYCGFLALQTVGVGFALYSYCRTYVARAVLDPRRSQLILTGCSLFGYPRTNDDIIQFRELQPGPFVTAHFIQFRLAGSSLSPSNWIWFRMPRSGGDVAAVKPGEKVGYRAQTQSAAAGARAPLAAAAVSEGSSTGGGYRRFLGAGLGADADISTGPALSSGPRRPSAKSVPAEAAVSREPQKIIPGLKLTNGLPASPQEEQKLFDFFEEPAAYGSSLE
eukprot:TRINITY_DN43129_c0_g1_i1.p1 TRINITY_DN43129_c0_g1~~TRINITY_DN43129_c0_g1_i1.p1  ORF type:complete len:338 (-),score=51.12 TRINITY_DN43129_c0_g1_i1:45-1058(-)